MQKAFLDAGKTMLLDVMCPALYRSPLLEVQDLKEFFKQETRAAYLTAIFLSDANQQGVRKIALDNLELFESKINKTNQTIDDVGQIQAILLNEYFRMLADPKLGEALTEGLRVLAEVQALLDASEGSERYGAGKISALRVSGDVKIADPLEETNTGREIIEIAVQNRAAKVVHRLLAATSAAGSAAGTPPLDKSGSRASAPPVPDPSQPLTDTSTGASAQSQAPEHQQTPSTAITEIDDRVARILKRLMPADAVSASPINGHAGRRMQRHRLLPTLHS